MEKPGEDPASSAKLCEGTGFVLADFRLWNNVSKKRNILLQQSPLLLLLQVLAERTRLWRACHPHFSRSPSLDNHVTPLFPQNSYEIVRFSCLFIYYFSLFLPLESEFHYNRHPFCFVCPPISRTVLATQIVEPSTK